MMTVGLLAMLHQWCHCQCVAVVSYGLLVLQFQAVVASDPQVSVSVYSVSRKKETKMFFCTIYNNTGAILIKFFYAVSWINLLQIYLDIFHLIWIMSLHYLVKCPSCRCYHCIVRERHSRIYPIPTVASKCARFKSSWLQHVGILQEKVYKTCITDLDELKQRLRTEWTKMDHVIIAAAIRQWRRQ